MFVLMRRPVLPEDEGRPEYIGAFKTRQDIQHVIKALCDDKYFSENDFYWIEEPRS